MFLCFFFSFLFWVRMCKRCKSLSILVWDFVLFLLKTNKKKRVRVREKSHKKNLGRKGKKTSEERKEDKKKFEKFRASA